MEEESKNVWEEELPENVASRIHRQGQETSDINGTLQAAISHVNALVDASNIDGEKMEIRDMKGGSNTLETRQRSGRNRRREKKKKRRSADAAERKKMTSDESVEDNGEDYNPSHPAKKKSKKNINIDTEVGKERKKGKGNVDKGIKETSNNDV
jgi:hypothetical protein